MIPPRGGPLRGQEQQLDALKRQRAEKLGEAEVVADEQTAFVPVERKGREVIAGGVVLVLTHRGKEMRFVVGCETRALPVKDIGGVVHAPAAPVGDRAGDDVQVQLAGERRAQRLHRLAAAVAPLRQMVGGEEAGVPSFRQQRGVRALRRRAAQQRLRVREIIGALTQTHIHLNDAQPHAQTSLNLVRTGSDAHAPAL